MKKVDTAAVFGGYVAIAGAFVLGALSIALFLPVWADQLVQGNREYEDEGSVILVLTSAPVVLFEVISLEVAYLLWLIHRDRMFSTRVYKWINLLGATFMALAGSFVAIGAWLMVKETMPPAVALVLAALSIVAAAIGLVTRSLLVLLRRANIAHEELEGVI